jgi:hypothetical protein
MTKFHYFSKAIGYNLLITTVIINNLKLKIRINLHGTEVQN